MIIKNQIVKMTWNSKHKKYYESKGYKFTKLHDEFFVNIEHLQKTSQRQVRIICNFCNKEYMASYHYAINIEKHCCRSCVPIKAKMTVLEKYNADCIAHINGIQEKTKKTNLDRYGVEHVLQDKEIREKIKKTNLEKYGVECILQDKEKMKNAMIKKYNVSHNFKLLSVREKRKKTFIKKYGVDHPVKCKEVQDKIKQTNITKYGVEYILQDKEKMKNAMIKKYGVSNAYQINKKEKTKKAIKTMYERENGVCSKTQQYLCNLFNVKSNYPVSRCSLDIAFPEEMIYIEYDGSGHNLCVKLGHVTQEEFDKKEIKRKRYIQNKGWKLIRIISKKDLIPQDNIILNLIKECKHYLNSGHSWVEIDIDNSKIYCAEYNKSIKLGNLRRVNI